MYDDYTKGKYILTHRHNNNVFRSNQEQLIRDPFDSEDLSLPLEFTPYGATQSAIFDPEMQELLSKPISYHHHEAGMVPDVFAADPAVSEMFEITSLNHDRGGKVFVSSMEARDFDTYPFWGVSICFQICHLLNIYAR